jgi:hypothetical protein
VLVTSAAVDCDPTVLRLPDQPPEAVQELAFVAVHESVARLPLAIVPGFAVRVTVGCAAAVTVVEAEAEPPGPVQARLNVVVCVNAPLDCEPLLATAPDHPPEAVQEVALVELHVRVVALPVRTTVGSALMVTVGAGGALAMTATVIVVSAAPLGPVQVSV